MEKTYLGIDCSTQKLKAVQINDKLEILYQSEVKFDTDFPEYQTNGGVRAGENPNEFYCDPVMWIRSLETVLDRLLMQGASFISVVSISGSAQQHGSVYWNQQGINTLEKLDPDNFLYNQLNSESFSVPKSPIWYDSSTSKQCREMEEAVGSKDEMVKITGSKCYERFTGAQIRKIFQEQPEAYKNTERISLVSSFLASIFLNKVAPIDHSDGSGMNLLDINTRTWSHKCLNACAENLEEKLGQAVPTDSIIGKIGTFFVQRYNFNHDCKVVAFTGDNPSAVAGLNIHDDWLAFSLGTSDTIMLCLDHHPAFNDGHVLIHPTKKDAFMGLLCFKNGALVRDTFKKAEANNSWEIFSELLQSAPRGNNGYMALHYLTQEILPNVKGTLRWSSLDSYENHNTRPQLNQFPTQQIEIRALIEGQMLNRKAYAMDIGFKFGDKTKILATGGTSINHTILKVMSDVFNSPVYIQKNTPEAACLGAVYRAKYVLYRETAIENGDTYDDYHNYIKKYCDTKHYYIQRVAEPLTDSQKIYDPMILRYRDMVKVMMKSQN